MVRRIFAGVVALGLLVGCGATEPQTSSTVTVTVTQAGPTVVHTDTQTVTATAAKPSTSGVATLAAGATASFGLVDMTYLGEAKGITRPDNSAGWAVKVRACATSAEQSIGVSWYPWLVLDESGGTYPASSSTYGSDPLPQYPFTADKTLPAGTCVQGWMVFEVNADTKPVTLRYANDAGEVATWKL